MRGDRGRSSVVPIRPKKLRCAIYTRKSSDEGLEQSFNSLDAQRDACEAYITSQKHEGWVVLPAAYDDGGFSGGSMERPALRQLLEDVTKRSIDVVVVYKVDRLTRSLSDFSRLTDLFDQHGVSFVSVTQQFNTSTSMGRLTLNVLLSFAQFEREVAGERIRDKIALSKRRGMWMGGLPPLGYDGIDRRLEVNEAEAETVRLIFRRYLAVGSIAALKRSLDADSVVSKRRTFGDGRTAGGVPLSRGAVYQILRNRLYRGEIAHRGEVHQGNHTPIVDEDLWNAVQDQLSIRSGRPRGARGSISTAPLAGIIFDADGSRLTPTSTTKGGRHYRYYVTAGLTRGLSAKDGIRIPAPDLERLVKDAVTAHLHDPNWLLNHLTGREDPQSATALIEAGSDFARALVAEPMVDSDHSAPRHLQFVSRVTVAKEQVAIELDRAALLLALDLSASIGTEVSIDDGDPLQINVPAHTLRSGKQVRLIIGEATSHRCAVDPDLVRLIRDAHRWFDDLRTGRSATIAEIAAREKVHVSHISRTISLAFLAPNIVEMILTGRQPPTITPERLKSRQAGLPLSWDEQRTALLG